ncbi:uncharacterized protein LOC128858983 [Anastrepha ludens]|uniref:uncharacterized protein LOC128858983 n=1 Tax=Anastrepha ludens TaxID=28586 RepID=UPI0023AEE928|nr:uncharacterized protein LOC128858983 [Anastrepha ludens]
MKAVILLSILAIAATVNGASIASNSSSVNLGQALKDYYKSLKNVMRCGDTEINLPVLAPFRKELVPLNYTDKYFSIKGNFSNIYITGLDSYYFVRYDFNEKTNVFHIDMMLPQLQVVGNVDVGSFVSVGGFPLRWISDGLINMKLVDFRVVSSFRFANNAQGHLQESNVKMNFYLGDMIVSNWNKLWNISGNNFFNKFLGEFIMMYSKQIQIEFNEIFNSFALPVINRSMEQLTQQEFIEQLRALTAKFNSVNC